MSTDLYLDDVGLGLLWQLVEAWEAFHVTRDDIGDVNYGGYRRESELIDRDIELDDIIIEFGEHVSFLYDHRDYDPRPKTVYPISDALLDEIAQMEFEWKTWGMRDADTLTELAIEALSNCSPAWTEECSSGD